MKIIQVNKFLYPRGGAETYLINLSQALMAKNHELIFFSQKNPKNIYEQGQEYFLNDMELGKFKWQNVFKIFRIFWSFKAARNIKNLIEEKKPQLVHLHNIYHQISPSILPAIKRYNIPIVMTVHDFKLIRPDYTLRADKKRSQKNLITRLILNLEFYFHKLLKIYERNISLFIAPSNFVKNQLIKHGFKENKIIVIYPGIDLSQYPVENLPPENYILSFGRLDESKGIDVLISAFSQLSDKNLKLKIAGIGPEKNNLKKLVQKLNLQSRVEFLGQLKKNKLITQIQKSLMTIFPSRIHETFGLGILESFACAKPVIASKTGAFCELVQDSQNGILFNVDDVSGLKLAIEYLLANPEKAKIMSQAARELAEQNYNLEKHYQNIIAAYQKQL